MMVRFFFVPGLPYTFEIYGGLSRHLTLIPEHQLFLVDPAAAYDANSHPPPERCNSFRLIAF